MANYFTKSATDLRLGTGYYFKFRWKYADGTYSDWSVAKYVLTAGTLQVESPTLPTGLSVATASFGVTASWDGTYSSSGFLGFKSINIYASTSDLGSTTTNDLTSKLVGSMTVDESPNKITIGSTLLKNVLSLTSTSVYTTPMYFYYISVNANNEFYKSSGNITYTRINSSGIYPTQANFVDLASGVISIENLVAGNGQFTEYLRAGLYDGARIEISGSTSNISSSSGGTVLPGFTIYDSGNQQVLRAPLSGGLTVTGATVKSSSSNKSIRLDPTYNSLSFYNADNAGVSHIVPMGSSGSAYQGIIIHSGSTPESNISSGLPTNSYPLIAMNRSSISSNVGNITLRAGSGNGLNIGAEEYNGIWYTNVGVSYTKVSSDLSVQSLRPITALSSADVGSSSPSTTTMNNNWSSSQEGLIALVYTA